MKYIVFAREINTLVVHTPVIFPSMLVHKMVADDLLAGTMKGWRVDSAGEISPLGMECHGESDTLNVASKPERDTRLILMNDYNAGLV
jgi:hypothetical protein